MKPARFTYLLPDTLSDALSALDASVGEAKAIAGGQSLIPLMNLRLASPQTIVDVGGLAELNGLSVDEGSWHLGATLTHASIERSEELARRLPLLQRVARHIGHPAIRSRGTLGGSLAHADPAAEWPTVMATLDASLLLTGTTGTRHVPARQFFSTFLTTVLEPSELLVEVAIPCQLEGSRVGFQEFSRQSGAFAIVLVCAVAAVSDRAVVEELALGFGGCADTPITFSDGDLPLVGEQLTDEAIDATAQVVSARLRPPSDIQATADDRRQLACVLARRALHDLKAPVANGGRRT